MSTELSIRAATTADLASLAHLARVTFAQAFEADMGSDATQRHITQYLSDDAFVQMLVEDSFFVALHRDRLAGFVQVGRVNEGYAEHVASFDASAGEVKRLYVLADAQNEGLGSALLERGLRELDRAGSIYLTTWEANTGAQNLYRRFGFRKVGQMPEYGSNGALNGYEYVMKLVN